MLIYSYINTSGNWKNEKLSGNTTPAGRSHTISTFSNFHGKNGIFPNFREKIFLYFFYNIAQRTLTEEWREIFRVDIELYQHGS